MPLKMHLKLSNICKSYGDKKVLQNISFEVSRGELVGLLGRNGAGKSTTFRILAGIISKNTGSIRWNGIEVEPTSKEWKKKIGYLAEHNPLFSDMYVEQFLNYMCKIYRVEASNEKIHEVINQVELQEYKKYKIKTLSKGYRQRVGIAQAIIHDPEILILDEPTSGLDPNQLIEIRQLIKLLSQERIVILSSHILKEVDQICSRIVIMNSGSVVLNRKHGTKSTKGEKLLKLVFDKPFQSDWFEHLGHVDKVDSKVMKIALKSKSEKGKIFDQAVKNKIRILEMTSEDVDLEQEFVSLTTEQ